MRLQANVRGVDPDALPAMTWNFGLSYPPRRRSRASALNIVWRADDARALSR